MSFHSKDELNSKIWNDKSEMKPKVRDRLLENANQFIDYLGVDIVVSDIIMIGSLCNYNWSEYSDVDLHIVIDYNQFPKNIKDIYDEFFYLKKTLYNLRHDIKLYGFDLEMFVQDEKLATFSSGIYSVLNDKWVNEPKKEMVEVDYKLIKRKVEEWMKTIDTLIDNIKDEPIKVANEQIKNIKDKLKKYRTCGLEKGGEYSDENLVFKALRRNGYIEKLFDYQTKRTDKELSLKEENLGSFFSLFQNKEDKGINTKIELAKKSTFLDGLKKIAESNKEYKNLKQSGQKIPYQKEVEIIQTGLQFLGYSLPKWGVDGLFGPETEKATKGFKKEYGLGDDGIFDTNSLKYLYAVLLKKDFSDADLAKIQKKSDFSKINVGNDKQFYEEVLKGIGAPITDGNMKFLFSWRQAEGGKATNNPFNTTQGLSKDTGISKYNKIGIKNYSTPQFGVEATVKTLLNGNYSCIVNGLKNDIGAEEISKCRDLKTWGTGELVAKVIDLGRINPPPIYA